jgi:hypothetical protein
MQSLAASILWGTIAAVTGANSWHSEQVTLVRPAWFAGNGLAPDWL